KELADLTERLLCLRYAVVQLVLSVRHTVENLELCVHTGLSELPVHTDRVAEQQISCPRGQDRRRKSIHISVARREQRVLDIMTVREAHRRSIAEPIARDQDVVHLFIRVERIASLRKVRHRPTGLYRARHS